MVIIKYSVHVEQKTVDEHLFIEDHEAVVVSGDSYHRVIYKEKDGVDVVLDISPNEVSLKRYGEWLTHGLFSSNNKSYLSVNNELGTLNIDIALMDLKYDKQSLLLKYNIEDEEGIVSEHEYICRWNRRDE
ncbi:DUF1934 domain-containing protein [Erysipelothrix urinaevulpis]|uniref:DUF1934 family protein n=1 Tax=Erysipelothrix urinaevulpis TaxID=2683717 RepID=UPI00135C4B0B|nr:DUF1934 family protein [Erysipelothrix urinaevulpis]